MPKHTKTCLHCGKRFGSARDDAVTCSPACRDVYHRERCRDVRRAARAKVRAELAAVCAGCGVGFKPSRRGVMFCHSKCRELADSRTTETRPTFVLYCAECGMPFDTHNAAQGCCSNRCAKLAHGRRKRRAPRHRVRCEGCPATFLPATIYQKFCSPACRTKADETGQSRTPPARVRSAHNLIEYAPFNDPPRLAAWLTALPDAQFREAWYLAVVTMIVETKHDTRIGVEGSRAGLIRRNADLDLQGLAQVLRVVRERLSTGAGDSTQTTQPSFQPERTAAHSPSRPPGLPLHLLAG